MEKQDYDLTEQKLNYDFEIVTLLPFKYVIDKISTGEISQSMTQILINMLIKANNTKYPSTQHQIFVPDVEAKRRTATRSNTVAPKKNTKVKGQVPKTGNIKAPEERTPEISITLSNPKENPIVKTNPFRSSFFNKKFALEVKEGKGMFPLPVDVKNLLLQQIWTRKDLKGDIIINGDPMSSTLGSPKVLKLDLFTETFSLEVTNTDCARHESEENISLSRLIQVLATASKLDIQFKNTKRLNKK